MAFNAYISAVGTKTAAALNTAGTITVNIDPVKGKRLSVLAYSILPGEVVTGLYFMTPLASGQCEVSTAAASGATGITLVSTPSDYGTSDVIVIELDNGKYQWNTVAASATTNAHITDILQDTVAAGNKVWYFGVYTDTGHYRIPLTASTAKSDSLDMGLINGSFKGGPMRVYVNTTSSGLCQLNYVSYVYTNV